MKIKFCLFFVYFFSVISSVSASIIDTDLLGIKEGSVVNLDKSTLPASLPSVIVVAIDDGSLGFKSTPKFKLPHGKLIKILTDGTTSSAISFKLQKTGNIYWAVLPDALPESNRDFLPNEEFYVAVNDVSSQRVKVGTKAELALIPETDNLHTVVSDEDEVVPEGEKSVMATVIAFRSQENSIPILLDMEKSELLQTPTSTGSNFQGYLPYGMGERVSGKGLYDLIAEAFKFEKILAAIEDTREDLNSPDFKAGPAILEFNTFLLTILGLPSTDYDTIVNILLESIDTVVESLGSQLALEAWNVIRAKLVESVNTEGGQYYITSLYYGILWNSFSDDGIHQSLGEFLTAVVKALYTPGQSKEALKEVFAPLNDNLKAKFVKNLDDLAKSMTYDPANSDNINNYALLRGLINKVVIDIIELIPADDLYTTLLALTSDCRIKNDIQVTYPGISVPDPVTLAANQPAEKCDLDPKLPGIYTYLTTTEDTHEEIKAKVIGFLETIVDMLTDVDSFSDIISKVVSRIESGEYTTDEVIDFLLKLGFIKEAPSDRDAFIASVIMILDGIKDTSRFNDGYLHVQPADQVMGIYVDPDNPVDFKINFDEIR